MYFITLSFLVRKIFTFYINDVLLFKRPVPGPKGEREHYHSDNERQLRLEHTREREQTDRKTDGLSRSAVIGGPLLSSLHI